jgi:hypothetical protein
MPTENRLTLTLSDSLQRLLPKSVFPLRHLLSFLNRTIFEPKISPVSVIGPVIFFPHTSETMLDASKTGRAIITIFSAHDGEQAKWI